eukprot:2397930-Alexandrium_andersonii.AAC.1
MPSRAAADTCTCTLMVARSSSRVQAPSGVSEGGLSLPSGPHREDIVHVAGRGGGPWETGIRLASE